MVHYPFILDQIRQEPTEILGLEVIAIVLYPYYCSVLVTAVMNPLKAQCFCLHYVHTPFSFCDIVCFHFLVLSLPVVLPYVYCPYCSQMLPV